MKKPTVAKRVSKLERRVAAEEAFETGVCVVISLAAFGLGVAWLLLL